MEEVTLEKAVLSGHCSASATGHEAGSAAWCPLLVASSLPSSLFSPPQSPQVLLRGDLLTATAPTYITALESHLSVS